jgi:hypothetical protein
MDDRPENCQCVKAERPLCNPRCWHYTVTTKAVRCTYCGQPPNELDVEPEPIHG